MESVKVKKIEYRKEFTVSIPLSARILGFELSGKSINLIYKVMGKGKPSSRTFILNKFEHGETVDFSNAVVRSTKEINNKFFTLYELL